MKLLPKRPLGKTGLEVSVLGFGASPLGGVFEAIDEEQGIASVHRAFERGITFFDTSPYYGDTRSERVLGKGLKALPRQEIIVASKVGRYASGFDFSASRVTTSVYESLERLQLSYLDIVHAHDIEFGDIQQVIHETLPALLELKKKGVIKYIGITGLPLKIFKLVLDDVPLGTIDVVLSYCHHTLSDNTLEGLVPYLVEKGVGIINASPLSMGLFTPQGPPDWHPAPPALKEAARECAHTCATLGVSLSGLAIKYSVSTCPEIASHLVGMCTPQQVDENIDTVLSALGLGLGDDTEDAVKEAEALNAIGGVVQPVLGVSWPSGCPKYN